MRGAALDRAFIRGMVPPRHATAMAGEEQMHGSDRRLKAIATSVVSTRAQEIGEMRTLLARGI
jgi:uncharacterized protein (DUF305 family)